MRKYLDHSDHSHHEERCLVHRPDWVRGHSRRGNALHALCKRGDDRWAEAREAYQTALEMEPGNGIVRRALWALMEEA